MNLREAKDYLGDMSEAMLNEGIMIQYCMPLSSEDMTGTRYPNVRAMPFQQ